MEIDGISFSLSDNFINKFKGKQPKWGPLGYFTYKRTYARNLEKNKTEEFWQTCQRVVEGCFLIQKKHCSGLNLPWSNHKAQKSAQEMFQRMWDFKFLPPGRGLWAMGTSFVFEKSGAALNNCFAYNTEIITDQGIKKIGDLVDTSPVILSSNGEWKKAPIKSFGQQQLYEIILSRQGMEKIIHCTPDHIWYVKDKRKNYKNEKWIERKTSDLNPEIDCLRYSFGQGVASIVPSPFGIAHGVCFGDGTRISGNNNSNILNLIGEKNKELVTYFSLCSQRQNESLNTQEEVIRISEIPNQFKEFPSLKENKSYLYGWLAGYFAADGKISKKGQIRLSSTKKENLEFVRSLCSKIGIGTYSITESHRISNLTNKQSILYDITLMGQHLTKDFFLISEHRDRFVSCVHPNKTMCNWYVKSVRVTDRIEEVFCAQVPDKNCFTLADNILTHNCGFISTSEIDSDFSAPFVWLMDMSMYGVGVGFDTKGSFKSVSLKTPKVTKDTHVVEDSREGWVSLFQRVLDAYVGRDSLPSEIDYSQIREAGTPIKGFGGIAPGPEPLKELVERVTATLDKYVEEERLVDVSLIVDLMNFAGAAVVAGGIRRTAEIAFGESEDEEFLHLKDLNNLKDPKLARWASNNSVMVSKGTDYSKLAEQTATNGEPGYFWLENAQNYGRMIDLPNYKDHRASGSNPCSEQTLESWELCNLVETFPSKHESLEDYKTTLKYAYLYAKTVTLLPTHDPRTNAVMLRNRRIGLSQTGIVENINKVGFREHLRWCDVGYNEVRRWDSIYSDWLCIPESIKVTSVKPSGTVSLLPGVTPGIHFPHSKYYIRRVRVAKTSPLWTIMKDAGYPVEPDKTQPEYTIIVSFPVHEQFFDRRKEDVSLWEQLELAAQMQAYWADNQVSVTVTIKPEESKDLNRALSMYESRLKSVSFLPLTEHQYEQAPYETITEEQYKKLSSKLKKVRLSTIEEEDRILDKFCDGEICEIKN